MIRARATSKHWRAKHYSLRLTRSRQLIITARRFNTNPANRSKRIRQLVFPLYLGSLCEIAIQQKQKRKPQRSRSKVSHNRVLKLAPQFGLVTLGLFGVVFFSSLDLQARALELPKTTSSHSSITVAQPQAAAEVAKSLPASQPVSISIPAENIQANVIPVGQAVDGSIQMPPLFAWATGWYDKSPTPGQIGPSIIVGHVDNYKNISVFWRLRYLTSGNLIQISRADGSIATFKVDAVQQFNQNSFPTQLVYANIPYAGLRLITCGGSFDESTASYTQNTVVFASLVL